MRWKWYGRIHCSMSLSHNVNNLEDADELGAERGILHAEAMMAPLWVVNAHSVMYMMRGHDRVCEEDIIGMVVGWVGEEGKGGNGVGESRTREWDEEIEEGKGGEKILNPTKQWQLFATGKRLSLRLEGLPSLCKFFLSWETNPMAALIGATTAFVSTVTVAPARTHVKGLQKPHNVSLPFPSSFPCRNLVLHASKRLQRASSVSVNAMAQHVDVSKVVPQADRVLIRLEELPEGAHLIRRVRTPINPGVRLGAAGGTQSKPGAPAGAPDPAPAHPVRGAFWVRALDWLGA
eukprot:Gb_18847 [translate_table: standard]